MESVTIPASVTTIGEGAFMFSSIASVALPGNLTAIDDYAFQWCILLRSITIPNRVSTIGEGAFSGCRRLAEVTIPDSVTEVGGQAFADCPAVVGYGGCGDGLVWVLHSNGMLQIVGSGVTTILTGAFNGCFKLAHVYYTGTEEDWSNISIYGENQQLVGAQRYIGDHAAIQITNAHSAVLTLYAQQNGQAIVAFYNSTTGQMLIAQRFDMNRGISKITLTTDQIDMTAVDHKIILLDNNNKPLCEAIEP